jgi:uncharacterized protein YbjT (DUF2867 family)
MNVILGASGQVGSAIIDQLINEKEPVVAVVRNPEKAKELERKGIQVRIADVFDGSALQGAIKEGNTLFVLTPETTSSTDVIGETKTLLTNYRNAINGSSIKKVVGLSSIGAQHPIGNLKMSYLLERAFEGLDVQTVLVRPAYYFSNWLLYLDTIMAEGLLPTFYPTDLKIPMISPHDVADFLTNVIVQDVEGNPIYELEGPGWCNPNDVATTFGNILGRSVEASQMPRERWGDQLQQAGFTQDSAKNFIEMTQAVNDGKAKPEGNGAILVKTQTTFKEYVADVISRSRSAA